MYVTDNILPAEVLKMLSLEACICQKLLFVYRRTVAVPGIEASGRRGRA